MTSNSVTSFLVTSYLGLRSRSEKVNNLNVKFSCYIESD